MNEAQEKLLLKHGVIILSEEIEHQTYIDILSLLLLAKDKTIQLFCRGDGGDSRAALAIVDLIQQHGNVIGMLPGEANSSHVTIWAGCRERYVYPHAAIGLHKVAWNHMESRLDSKNAALIAKEFEGTERKIARLLASISDRDADYWFDVMDKTGSSGVHQIDCAEIIERRMAQPVRNYKMVTTLLDTQSIVVSANGSE